MTEERLWEVWEKIKDSWSFTLTPEGDAFLRTGNLPEGKLATGAQLLYNSYPQELIRELDGDNAALSSRMLRILADRRSQGMIPSYGWEGDTQLCCRIGFSFDEVLQGGFFRYNNVYDGKYTYRLAGILLWYFPEESKKYVNMLQGQTLSEKAKTAGRAFKSFFDELLHYRKSDKRLYLTLCLAQRLLLQDRNAFASSLPFLEQCVQSFSNDYIAVLLYQMWNHHLQTEEPPLSEKMAERFRQLILESIPFNLTLTHQCMDPETFPALLQSLGLPAYPAYCLQAIDCMDPNSHKASIFQALYQSDRESFLETYRRVAALPNYEQGVYSLGLLAILLRNGGGVHELEEAQSRILVYPGILNTYFGDKTDLVKKFLKDDTLSPEEIAEKRNLRFDNTYLQYGAAGALLTLYAPLYTYSSTVKRLFHLLIAAGRRDATPGNLATIYGYFLAGRQDWLGISPVESAELLIAGGFTRLECFNAYCVAMADTYSARVGIESGTTAALVKGHTDEAAEFLVKGTCPPAGKVAWMALLYQQCGFSDDTLLLDLLRDKSKQIRSKAEELISAREEALRPLLEARSPQYRGEAAQSARRLLRLWDNERKFGKDFTFTDNALVVQFCQDNYNTANEKALSWIPEDMFLGLRYADLTEEAPPIVAKYLLVEYLSLTTPYRIRACDKVVQRLHPQDLQGMLENIYHLWLDNGADTKKKGILVPYCIYGADSQIIAMKRQIEQWAENSRGALGAYAVNGVALNGGSVALMMVDGMAAKFPNNQVKNAARAAFSFAAAALDVPEDVLADRIVPDLGFGRHGEKILDYGPRTFTVSLLPDFSLSILDNEKGKTVKSLPKPGAKDDPVKAEAAKKAFSELKKQIKAVVQTQSGRLERVLMNGRRWTVDRWEALFVENAVMHQFATGLIWGVYQGDVLEASFRYMADGTFNTVEEDEYQLPEKAEITLVHPLDLEDPVLEAWKEQLEDYEVSQPIPQLFHTAPTLKEGDLDGSRVIRYQGLQVTAGKLAGIAKKYNLIRGEVLDGGSYTCFHLADKYLGIGAQLNFEFMYMGQEFDEIVPLETLLFYRLPESNVFNGDPEPDMILDPWAVLPRFVSSVLAIFDVMSGKNEVAQ